MLGLFSILMHWFLAHTSFQDTLGNSEVADVLGLPCHVPPAVTSLLAVYVSALESTPCLASEAWRAALWAGTRFWGFLHFHSQA